MAVHFPSNQYLHCFDYLICFLFLLGKRKLDRKIHPKSKKKKYCWVKSSMKENETEVYTRTSIDWHRYLEKFVFAPLRHTLFKVKTISSQVICLRQIPLELK